MNNILKKSVFIILVVLPFFIYFLTASRQLTWGDGAEFFVAVKNLGIPHPTGYPLFMLIARIRFLLFPDPFMFNLLSGAFSAIAALVLGLIIFKMTRDQWLSISLALFFSFGRAVWLQSVVAEVYSLNLLFFVLLLYFVIQIETNNRASSMVYFLCGLALTNHLTAIFYVIPFMFYQVLKAKKISWQMMLAILPLALYLYLPIRSRAQPVPDLFDPQTFNNFITYITARAFQYRSWSLSSSGIGQDLIEFLRDGWYQLLILFPFVFYGFFKIKSRGLRLLLSVTLIIILIYTITYDIPDKQGYYLPLYVIMLILIAAGLNKVIPEKLKYLLIVLPGISIAVNYNHADLASDKTFDGISKAVYKALPDSSIFISEDYFLYYGILDLEQQEKKGVIPVQQFYLCMDWYIKTLRNDYPQLTVPSSIMEYLAKTKKHPKAGSKKEYGETNKQKCFVVQKMLIEANIDSIPISYYIYDDSHWPDNWLEYALSYHGLYYQFHRSEQSRLPFDLHLKEPMDYTINRAKSELSRLASQKIAAAYNRRGIFNFQLNKSDAAINDFNTALEIDTAYAQAYMNIGMVHVNNADTISALNAWYKFLQLAPDDPNATRVRAWIKHITTTR